MFIMSPEIQKKHDEKLKRITDAIALKEPDCIPVTPHAGLFPVFNAGYTVAEIVYDTTLEKVKHAMVKYMNDFDPDAYLGLGSIFAGEGPGMELSKPKTMRWAGMPGDVIDKNSLQQFIEFPLLLDDEFDEFFSDRTGWMLSKSLPRQSEVLEPLKMLKLHGTIEGSAGMIASIFGTPEFSEMIEQLKKVNEFYIGQRKRANEINEELSNLGYPSLRTGVRGTMVPFDLYSDFLRGTMLSMVDLYDRPEDIERFINEGFAETIEKIKATKGVDEGKQVFMPLHKGMDGFMSDEHYRKYYWRFLQEIIEALVYSGKIPYIYTEGKYNTRLDCLREVTPGKVIYHFEDVDMAVAKKKLGGIACISGGFPSALLDWSTPDKVRDEVKRLIDICAPGGGFIFETSCGMGNAKRENVEAMFETARKYGVYK